MSEIYRKSSQRALEELALVSDPSLEMDYMERMFHVSVAGVNALLAIASAIQDHKPKAGPIARRL